MDPQKYSSLQYHIGQIESILNDSFPTLESGQIKHLVDSKTSEIVLQQVIKLMDGRLASLRILLEQKAALSAKGVADVKEELVSLDKIFGASESKEIIPRDMDIEIAPNVCMKLPLFKSQTDIPIRSYGIIIKDRVPYVLYRFSKTKFVSCTSIHVAQDGGPMDNYRTLSCTNWPGCQWSEKCKYFHDPVLAPSQHVQRVPKTTLVKTCPLFGHAPFASHDVKSINFEQLRTLGRYMATMMLLIGKAAVEHDV